MSKQNFIAFAKICSCELACKYVNKKNYGEDVDEILNKILLLDGYIEELESYENPCCSDFMHEGVKNIGCDKVVMSKNNSLYLTSNEQKIKFTADMLNCLSESQVCELTDKIKSICTNC